MSFGFLHLAAAIPAFLARHPDVTVDMSLTDRFVDLVDEGFDVAVRIGMLRDSSLVARRLAPSRLVVCAAPSYLARHGTPLVPADLVDHECLHNTNIPGQWSFTAPGGGVQLIDVAGRLSANNGDALQAAARAGAGLVYLPSFIVGEDLQAGRLVAVLADFTMVGATVNAVYPHARHLSPKVRVFVDFLAGRFGPEPYWDAPLSKRAGASPT
jgi:DNA-binding transcriptional LysR family regulator